MVQVDCLQPVETALPNSMPAYYLREDQHTYINKENVLYATTHLGFVITVDQDGNEVKNELTELIDFIFGSGSVITTRMNCFGVMTLLTPSDIQIKMEVPEETEQSQINNFFDKWCSDTACEMKNQNVEQKGAII